MHELRVISGFHRGATLPLDERTHIIGANDGADVVLIDSSIAEHHATLHRTSSGWLMTASGGAIYTANKHLSQKSIHLDAGNFVLIGDVWLAIVEQDAPWTEPPNEVIEASKTSINKKRGDSEVFQDANQSICVTSEQNDLKETNAKTIPQNRGLKFVFAPFAAVAILSAAAAYAMTVKSSTQHQMLAVQPETTSKTLSETSLSQEQLREIFRKRLSEAELLQQFELNLKDNSWKMNANLDDEETKRFEKILQSFMQEFKVTFPVNAEIAGPDLMLPFKVRSVVSGANASLVTQEGRRIFVGEEYRGVRLVAINNNRIVFSGKRKIEMDW